MSAIEFLRQFRISGLAIFDFTAAFLGIYLISPFLSRILLKIRLDAPRRSWLFFTLPISIVVHLLVGNLTPLTKNFLDLHGHFLFKAIIIGLFILGTIGIRFKKITMASQIANNTLIY